MRIGSDCCIANNVTIQPEAKIIVVKVGPIVAIWRRITVINRPAHGHSAEPASQAGQIQPRLLSDATWRGVKIAGIQRTG